MTDKEFYDWFVPRAEQFAEMGIMHPRSEWGKIVKICLMANEVLIAEIKKEILKELREELQKEIEPTIVKEKPKKEVKEKPQKTSSTWIIKNK